MYNNRIDNEDMNASAAYGVLKMNCIGTWLLKRAVKQVMRQYGRRFAKRDVIGLYSIIQEAAEDEFSEDNDPTIHFFLKECFDKAQQCKRS